MTVHWWLKVFIFDSLTRRQRVLVISKMCQSCISRAGQISLFKLLDTRQGLQSFGFFPQPPPKGTKRSEEHKCWQHFESLPWKQVNCASQRTDLSQPVQSRCTCEELTIYTNTHVQNPGLFCLICKVIYTMSFPISFKNLQVKKLVNDRLPFKS